MGPTDAMQLYHKNKKFTSPFSSGVFRNCLLRDSFEPRVVAVFQANLARAL